jgi:oligopeptidase B
MLVARESRSNSTPMKPDQRTPRPAPPSARRMPRVDLLHGERRVDSFHWLREKDNPDVHAYLEAENAYTAEVMAPHGPLIETLYREMVGHIQETDMSVPYRDGAFDYYVRTEEGRQYSTHCRRAPGGTEQITLDLNALAQSAAFIALGVFAVSDDGRYLAHALDKTGFREYTLAVKDLTTGVLLPDQVPHVTSAAWAADDRTLFYTVEDAAKRSYRLYRHRLGETNDDLVLEEHDERFDLAVTRTRSGVYLLLDSSSHTANEVRFLPASEPEGEWRLLAARRPEHEYSVDHRGQAFYIRTNDRGRNFRLVVAPIDEPGEQRWQELVAHRAEVMLDEHLVFAHHAVLFERSQGLPAVRILDLDAQTDHRVQFQEPAYSLAPSANRVFDTGVLRFTYESLVTPPSVFDYDMRTRERTLLKRTPVPGYDPECYASERVYAPATGGVRVPVSLAYRKDLKHDGPAPLLLYGYGAYGIALDAHFSSARLTLLDRGVVFAIAHVRGGGELGKPWHDQGRMLAKHNSFDDFIAAAEHLFREGWTAPDRLAIQGGSAGGLLIGAVINLRPALARAALLNVPFVDVVSTMLDETLPLTVGEFEEWGDPRRRDEYDAIRSYCPYTNLVAGDYPAMLVTTSLNDSQVMYWEPAKYVARLRTLKTDDRPLLLKTNMAAGHGGASGRYDRLREIAFEYAFALSQLGAA